MAQARDPIECTILRTLWVLGSWDADGGVNPIALHWGPLLRTPGNLVDEAIHRLRREGLLRLKGGDGAMNVWLNADMLAPIKAAIDACRAAH